MKYSVRMKIKHSNIRTARLKKKLGFLFDSWKRMGLSEEEQSKKAEEFWKKNEGNMEKKL